MGMRRAPSLARAPAEAITPRTRMQVCQRGVVAGSVLSSHCDDQQIIRAPPPLERKAAAPQQQQDRAGNWTRPGFARPSSFQLALDVICFGNVSTHRDDGDSKLHTANSIGISFSYGKRTETKKLRKHSLEHCIEK